MSVFTNTMTQIGRPYQLLRLLEVNAALPDENSHKKKRIASKIFQLCLANMLYPEWVGGGKLDGNLELAENEEIRKKIGIASPASMSNYRESMLLKEEQEGYLERRGNKKEYEYRITEKGKNLLSAYKKAFRLQERLLGIKEKTSLQIYTAIEWSENYLKETAEDFDTDEIDNILDAYEEEYDKSFYALKDSQTRELSPQKLLELIRLERGRETIQNITRSEREVFLGGIKEEIREEEMNEIYYIVGPGTEKRAYVSNRNIDVSLKIDATQEEEISIEENIDIELITKSGLLDPSKAIEIDERKLVEELKEKFEQQFTLQKFDNRS